MAAPVAVLVGEAVGVDQPLWRDDLPVNAGVPVLLAVARPHAPEDRCSARCFGEDDIDLDAGLCV
jgi:hypothetical protein